jgi:tetratricopeptide (TPR) repeat protein
MNTFGARFGALIKHRRGVEGLTQEALAVLAFGDEANKSRISELENGRVPNPHQRNVDALVVALGLSEADLASCRLPRVPSLPEGFSESIGLTQELIDALSWSFGFAKPKATNHEYQDFLRYKAQELRNLQTRIGLLGEDLRISNLMAAATAEIKQGQFGKADELFAAAEEIQQAEHTLKEVHKQAEIRRARGDASLLSTDSTGAYEHYAAAATFVAVFDPLDAAQQRYDDARKLFLYGRRFSDTAIECAVALVSVNLTFYSAEKHPLQLGRTYYLRSVLYREIGSSKYGDRGTKLLDQAADAARRALSVLSRDEHLIAWGDARNNLALSMNEQGRRLEGAAGDKRLTEAIAIHRETIGAITKDASPVLWAMLQNNLSLALIDLARRKIDTESNSLSKQSVDACRSALEVRTRNEYPNEWAMTQNNLGIALRALGHRTPGALGLGLLNKAVEAYRNAIEVNSFDSNPVEWSKLQNNMGNALKVLGGRMEGKAAITVLEQALAALNSSSKVRTQDAYPLYWAETMQSIGETQILLGKIEKKRAREYFRAALNSFESALAVFDPANTSLGYKECIKAKVEATFLLEHGR